MAKKTGKGRAADGRERGKGGGKTGPLSRKELDALRALDTPTVCNALEVLDPKSFASGFSVQPFVCAFPQLGSMVGYACTGTIRASRPSGRSAIDQRNLRFGWFDYISAMAGPRVVVLQDIDERRGYGAFWGEVQSNVHKALGCAGVVTDGSVRDLHMAAEGFQFIAGSVGPSHAYVHMAEFGVRVEVHGMAVNSGDLVHADQHGAVVIPHHLARQIVDAAARVGAKEKIILDACKAPDFTPDTLKAAIIASMQSGY
jgi:regulator of RNase E activity RraA